MLTHPARGRQVSRSVSVTVPVSIFITEVTESLKIFPMRPIHERLIDGLHRIKESLIVCFQLRRSVCGCIIRS